MRLEPVTRSTAAALGAITSVVLLTFWEFAARNDTSTQRSIIKVERSQVAPATPEPLRNLGPKIALSRIDGPDSRSSSQMADAVAIVDGSFIARSELDRIAGPHLFQLRIQEYSTRRAVLERAIERILIEREAARRGVAVEELARTEIALKAEPVSAEELSSALESSAARLAHIDSGRARQIVTNELRQARLNARRRAFVKELKDRTNTRVLIGPLRFQLNTLGHTRGRQRAPITIVTFSDFSCAACGRAFTSLRDVETRYQNEIRTVFRHFPSTGNKQAEVAAEAAECAAEQGLFWRMHDMLFARAGAFAEGDLPQIAFRANLNVPEFTRCLASRRYREVWARDRAYAEEVGLSTAPAFFVNGRVIIGGVASGDLTAVIDDELRYLSSSTPISASMKSMHPARLPSGTPVRLNKPGQQ